MRKAEVFVNNHRAGILIENSRSDYEFVYDETYEGNPVSLTMPIKIKTYKFKSFPSYFEGLLPEGVQLEFILRDKKINRDDLFSLMMVCGADCVGAVSLRELNA